MFFSNCHFLYIYLLMLTYSLVFNNTSPFNYRVMYQRRTESTTLDHWCPRGETLKTCSKSMRDKSNRLSVKRALTRPGPIKTMIITIKEMRDDPQNMKLLCLGRKAFCMYDLAVQLTSDCNLQSSRKLHSWSPNIDRDNMPLRFNQECSPLGQGKRRRKKKREREEVQVALKLSGWKGLGISFIAWTGWEGCCFV